MRIATLVLAMTFACATAPAFAQARVLTAPEPAQAQAPDRAQSQAQDQPRDWAPVAQTPAESTEPALVPKAPATSEAQTPAPTEAEKQSTPETLPKPVPQAQEPPAPAGQTQETPVQAQAPTPAETEAPAKTQDQLQRSAPRRERVRLRPRGRYGFSRIENGFLRFDRQSGRVSVCMPRTAGWSCEAVPEDRARLEKEIDQLREEVTALKREIASLRAPPPRPRPPQTVPLSPPPPDRNSGGVTIKLPMQEDIARARGFLADTWYRLMEMITHWQKDMLRRS